VAGSLGTTPRPPCCLPFDPGPAGGRAACALGPPGPSPMPQAPPAKADQGRGFSVAQALRIGSEAAVRSNSAWFARTGLYAISWPRQQVLVEALVAGDAQGHRRDQCAMRARVALGATRKGPAVS